MGGMAAQIPIKNDEKANAEAIGKVRADKEREAGDGHDGTWVAHPGLVPVALEIFDREMTAPNQIDRKLEDVKVSAEDLLTVPEGKITEKGLRHNLDVGIRYLAAWLTGKGCVPIYNLMEDAATSEISRSQVWQWVRHGAALEDGRTVTLPLVRTMLAEELYKIEAELGKEKYESGRFKLAGELFKELFSSKGFSQWLTLPAYAKLG